MSAPTVLSTSPGPNETGIVLGQAIRIVFNQPIDQATLNDATFALIGPGQTSLVDADEMGRAAPTAQTGREYITGIFSFPAPDTAVFTPSRPLRPGVTYQALLSGSSSLLAKNAVRNPAGEILASAYKWQFTTGSLDLKEPPAVSPVAPANDWERPRINPNEIRVTPRKAIGNDLTLIELEFPDEIDETSFDPRDLVVTLEAIINDPQVEVPLGLAASVTVLGNKLSIVVSGSDEPVTAGSVFPRVLYGYVPPTAGTYKQNDRMYNLAPMAGGAVGWICVEGSSEAYPQGKWQSFGVIGAD
jgi:hypothetical protein